MFTPTSPPTLPAQTAAAENATGSSESAPLIHNLMLPEPGKIYHGVWLPVQEELNPEEIDAFQQQVGHPLDSIIYYVSWGKQDWEWCEKQLQIAGQQELLLQIVWEPWLPGEENPLQAIADGKMDDHIRHFAGAAASFGKPFFLRFAHEMNGDWYPWSGEQSGRDPQLFIRAWQHVWNIFDEEGAANAIWVWAPNYVSDPAESWNAMQHYYPGEEYVDWVGVDFYGLKWTNEYPEDMLDETYILYAHSHPIMIAETAASDPDGSLEGSANGKPLWIQRLFGILPLYPKVRAVYWFNEKKEADWRIQSEPYPDALNAYIEGWRNLTRQ